MDYTDRELYSATIDYLKPIDGRIEAGVTIELASASDGPGGPAATIELAFPVKLSDSLEELERAALLHAHRLIVRIAAVSLQALEELVRNPKQFDESYQFTPDALDELNEELQNKGR